MTDLVERLSTAADWNDPHAAKLYREAADEIERLRKVLRTVYDWCGYDAPNWQEIERVLDRGENLMAFAWSWSALDSFETCPKKHWHTRIKKDYVEPESEQMLWGKQVHDALANRIAKGRNLPKTMPYEDYVEKVMENSDRTKVTTKVEQQLAVTEDMTPCQYFDKQVDPWCRVVADVLKVNDEAGVARVVDWKTGKGKFHTDDETGVVVADETGQLNLSAALIFAHYPAVAAVWAQYVWLQEGVITEELVTRDDLPRFWSHMLPRVDRMEQAYRTTEYLPKPSGLCVRHCPVTSCPYHGRGNRR